MLFGRLHGARSLLRHAEETLDEGRRLSPGSSSLPTLPLSLLVPGPPCLPLPPTPASLCFTLPPPAPPLPPTRRFLKTSRPGRAANSHRCWGFARRQNFMVGSVPLL